MHTSTIRGLDARVKMAGSRLWKYSDQRKASELVHDAIGLARQLGRTDFNEGCYRLPCFFSDEPLLSEAWRREQDTGFLVFPPTSGDLRGLGVRIKIAVSRMLSLVDPHASEAASWEASIAAIQFCADAELGSIPSLFASEPYLIEAWKFKHPEAVHGANVSSSC